MKRVESTFRKSTDGIPTKAKIPKEAEPYIFVAMAEYSQRSIALHDAAQAEYQRRMCFAFFGYFRKMNWEEFVLALRARSLRKMKRATQRIANANNRKYYVIRSSQIGYKRFSTEDAKFNKKIHVFGRDVNVVKLSETADAIIYPKKRK